MIEKNKVPSKVLIINNNKLTIFAIREILNRAFDYEIVIHHEVKNDFNTLLNDKSVKLVFIDAGLLSEKNMRMALQKNTSVNVIALISNGADLCIRHIIKDSVDGIIENSHDADTIISIIQLVIKGFQCIPQDKGLNENNRRISNLTQRELDIFYLISEGMSNKEIASVLNISHKTVSVHRYNIMFKLRINNSAEFSRIQKKQALPSFLGVNEL